MTNVIPAIVLGGTGYVAGELLRLLVGHPYLKIVGVMSESRAGSPIRKTFPQLQMHLGDSCFGTKADMLGLLNSGPLALFSAAPHGASAALVAEFLAAAEGNDCHMTVVDASADFRYPDAAAYEAVYDQPHGAPELLGQFTSAVPEHQLTTDLPHVGHPGCFSTAMLMAAVPLIKFDIVEPDLYAVGITGSTGSGRTPTESTHHPERQSNLFAYKPLAHRHCPEVRGICELITGIAPGLRFIPHSGPFARGIHITMQARLRRKSSADEVRQILFDYYADSAFVCVKDGTPRVKDVVGSNYCHLGVATDSDSVALFVVIDNLVKGAAGGAVQWMNRKLGFAETTGLLAPAIAWV
jgi:N-acetyl-gamma-glutamyl-phosphate reductase common form